MAWNNPSIQDFKSQFFRDFPYGEDFNGFVLDQDIASAFQCTNMNINQGLFSDQASYSYCYNLLSAHYMVENLRASSQGINGQYTWLQNSKSVGAVNEAFSIPQYILDNPLMAALTKTNYGAKYLELIYPSLAAGGVFTSCMPAHSL